MRASSASTSSPGDCRPAAVAAAMPAALSIGSAARGARCRLSLPPPLRGRAGVGGAAAPSLGPPPTLTLTLTLPRKGGGNDRFRSLSQAAGQAVGAEVDAAERLDLREQLGEAGDHPVAAGD